MKKQMVCHVAALLLFGFNGIVASRIALESEEIVLWRTLTGSLFLAGVFFLSGLRPTAHRHRRDLLLIAVSGAAMGCSWICLYAAYRALGVSLWSLLYYCGPVFVMALSPLLFHEKLTVCRCVCFAAVAVRRGLVFRTGGSLGWLLLLGVVNTGLGCLLYFSSIGALPVQTVAILGYLEPLSAVVFAALFLHEQLQPAELCGAALILGGAVCGTAAGQRKPAISSGTASK